MDRLARLATLPFAFGLLSLAGHAQPDLVGDRIALSATAGLDRTSGVPTAVGSAYKATFDRGGVTFVPALGAAAPRNLPVRLDLLAFGRDQGTLFAPSAAEPTATDRRVEYRRARVIERYDVKPEGLHQSFVFDALPEGDGDLVVRVRFATDLQPRQIARDAIEFAHPDLGGVTMSGLVGIDAGGRRAAGALTVRSGAVELRLPGAFVDRARLPLVLDPLIGTTLSLASRNDDSRPEVAYDASTDRYLVVWECHYSSTDIDLCGQRIDSLGNLVGARISIRNTSRESLVPSVANIAVRDAFVVVWNEGQDVWASAVRAADGSVLGAVPVATGPDAQWSPVVGGEATTIDDDALVVWHNNTQNVIRAAQVTVNLNGSLSVTAPVDVSTGADDVRGPAISRTGGGSGRHLIVWTSTPLTLNSRLIGAVVDRNGGILDRRVLAVGTSRSAGNPKVDGDGQHWVFSFRRPELSGGSNAFDLFSRSVAWDLASQSAKLTSGEVSWGSPATSESVEAVTWLGASVVTAHHEVAGSAFDLYLRSADTFSCEDCEGVAPVSVGSNHAFHAGMAQGPAGEGLLVWQSGSNSAGYDVMARRFRADDGTALDLGLGCGGAVASQSCAVNGNTSFTMRLSSAPPFATAWLTVSTRRIDQPCGPCTIVPDPFGGYVYSVGLTSASGEASASLPLRAAVGLTGMSFYQQWFIATGGGCMGAALSNALESTIQ